MTLVPDGCTHWLCVRTAAGTAAALDTEFHGRAMGTAVQLVQMCKTLLAGSVIRVL